MLEYVVKTKSSIFDVRKKSCEEGSLEKAFNLPLQKKLRANNILPLPNVTN
jgi:hypothetical protein